MKRLLLIISILTCTFSTLTLTTSCSENEEVGEYDNWKERNQHFVDSIAALASSGTDGWEKFVAYNLDSAYEASVHNTNHYIYVKKIEEGKGEYNALYNDSVRVHYLGRLIPTAAYPQGYIFDKSYSSYALNEATDVPTPFMVRAVVTGFTTALLHMVEGDRWQVVIPYYLGYGDTSSSETGMEGYSTLIFDIKLARIYKYRKDTNTSWH